MALSTSQLQALLAPASKGKAGNAWVRIVDQEGVSTLERQQVKTSTFGKFEGKIGTKRRSAKGRVSINPNGYRKYNDGGYEREIEVVAYLA